MRISDWSSDVCSSDLHVPPRPELRRAPRPAAGALPRPPALEPFGRTGRPGRRLANGLPDAGLKRSEEHTSELQPLMRSSYAVFGLKNKKMGSGDEDLDGSPTARYACEDAHDRQHRTATRLTPHNKAATP